MLGWFPLALWVDAVAGTVGAVFASLGTWLLLALVWRMSSSESRRALLACVLWSTCGEIALTELFGLYHYRFGFVPPFVPPGHALLFQCGVWITAALPAAVGKWSRMLAVPVSLAAFVGLGDEQSLLYLLVFIVLLAFGPNPSLYGTMYFLSLALELVGTSIGTWVWRLEDPVFGLRTCNPPIAAGVFYCALDALVILTQRFWGAPGPDDGG